MRFRSGIDQTLKLSKRPKTEAGHGVRYSGLHGTENEMYYYYKQQETRTRAEWSFEDLYSSFAGCLKRQLVVNT